VFFLNGIMMNCMSWAEFVPSFSKSFQLILLDFRDQGRSSKLMGPYDLDRHASDMVELLDALGFDQVHVMGLSYGGQVALRFALHQQERLRSLILANVVRGVSNHLRAIGQAWERAAELGDGERFFQLAIPFIYSSSFYDRSHEYLQQRQELFKSLLTEEWFESLIRLNRSVDGYAVSLEELGTISVPTLLIGADDDMIAPLGDIDEMYEALPESELIVLHKAGHGAFLERKEEFATAVVGFVAKHTARRRHSGQ
jgi:pimeloyl-ACP methyl ester carboxylesterase